VSSIRTKGTVPLSLTTETPFQETCATLYILTVMLYFLRLFRILLSSTVTPVLCAYLASTAVNSTCNEDSTKCRNLTPTATTKRKVEHIGCPTRYRTRHFFNKFTTNEIIATQFEADLPHCVRNVKEKNVFLFKFRCNIFIGVRIIKEMPGSVASGTPCIKVVVCVARNGIF